MDIKKWIVNNLKDDCIVIEAGTAGGSDTLFFSNYFINGKIYGFEPIPHLFNDTLKNTSGKLNVEIYNLALSNKTEKSKIYFSDRFGHVAVSSSLLKPKDHLQVHPEISFKEEIDIECINLDDFYESNNLNIIDFMWLDMQGLEPIVLKSSPNCLRNTKFIYSEVSLIETYEGVMLYPEFKEFMIKNNFEIVFEDLPWVDMGNVLFQNKNKL
jgi:FkbM family methyltransferase